MDSAGPQYRGDPLVRIRRQVNPFGWNRVPDFGLPLCPYRAAINVVPRKPAVKPVR